MFGYRKDGGPKSHVAGWFIESKKLATLALLRFFPGTREAYHTHAFNSISIVLGPGYLEETFLNGSMMVHKQGDVVRTRRADFHQVRSVGTTYVLTLRGPWMDMWVEQTEEGKLQVLTHDRKVLNETIL